MIGRVAGERAAGAKLSNDLCEYIRQPAAPASESRNRMTSRAFTPQIFDRAVQPAT